MFTQSYILSIYYILYKFYITIIYKDYYIQLQYRYIYYYYILQLLYIL